jgi:cobalt-zinc-cadmium efflux system protein
MRLPGAPRQSNPSGRQNFPNFVKNSTMAGHEQHHHGALKGRNLFISVALNLGITVAQVIGGILSGSMALLSDALHNFSDVLSLLITYITYKLAKRKNTKEHTFGYQRGEILAAFVNSAVLLIIAALLGFEAVNRIINPEVVNSVVVIWLAVASIMVNGFSVLLIHSGAKESINIKSAYLHLFTDMLTSIAVLAGGLFMKYLGWYWVDGLVTLLIAFYLIYAGWHLFKESVNIIMLFSPKDVDIELLTRRIEAISGVKNLHHLHLWRLTDNKINLEAHIDVEKDQPISLFEKQLEEIKKIAGDMGIGHVTIQPEYTTNDDKQLIHNHK